MCCRYGSDSAVWKYFGISDEGSPKSQTQDEMLVAFETDASVKCVVPATQAVSAVKLACGEAFMVTVLLMESKQPVALVTIRLTLNVPLCVKACVGFLTVDVLADPDVGSPKFHNHSVTAVPPPVCERSLN